MRAVIQRVTTATVTIDNTPRGQIGPGLLILLGIADTDTPADIPWLVEKCASLRIFPDASGAMSLSVRDTAGGALVISQFTLIASCRKGARPSFHHAAKPDHAKPLYEQFLAQLSAALGKPVEHGEFGAMMRVSLVNDGPVTIVIDTP